MAELLGERVAVAVLLRVTEDDTVTVAVAEDERVTERVGEVERVLEAEGVLDGVTLRLVEGEGGTALSEGGNVAEPVSVGASALVAAAPRSLAAAVAALASA